MPEIIDEEILIGVHICPMCNKIMKRCVHSTYGWNKYICDICKFVIPVG